MSFSIVTDTSANLPTPLLRRADVSVIPFYFTVDGHEDATCMDTETFDGSAFYGAMRSGTGVRTSQINPQAYIDHFEPLLAAGQDILFIGMSSGISGSYHSAQLALSQLKPSYPDRQFRLVDTLGASLGEGLWVIKAIEWRDEGVSLDEIAHRLLTLRKRMCQVFVVDDLMFLKKTGRLSGAAALVGTVLNIKPLLKGNEKGQIVNFAKVRGRKKAIEALAECYDRLVVDAGSQVVGIAHADCAEDAERLKQLLMRKLPPKEVMTVMYEPVTGSHVGPGTLALFFLGGDDVRSK